MIPSIGILIAVYIIARGFDMLYSTEKKNPVVRIAGLACIVTAVLTIAHMIIAGSEISQRLASTLP